MVNGVRPHSNYRNKRRTLNVSRETLHIMTDYLTWCINYEERVIMIEFVKILEKAQENYDEAMHWFNRYRMFKDDMQYNLAHDYMTKAETYLDAYAIVTGENIKVWDIAEELKRY